MKRVSAILLVFILMLGAPGAEGAYFPTHVQENSNAKKTRAINVVINNMVDIEEETVDFLMLASVMEDTDFYIYTFTGNLSPIKLENNAECINKIIKDYTKKQSYSEIQATPGYIAAVNDTASLDYQQKEVYVLLDNSADIEEQSIRNAYFSYMNSISGVKITVFDLQDHWHKSNVSNNPDYVAKEQLYRDTFLAEYGYTAVPGNYYKYDRSTGTVTIEQGRADANILVYAYATKDDYLYISGYMATGNIYAESKEKKTVKGVSLGYNAVNLEKTASPRNVAWQLFSIDEGLYDVNTNSFIIPVKNAEHVSLYYNANMGSGACSKATKYNRAQDDKIVNRYAPANNTGEEEDTVINSIIEQQLSNNLEKSSIAQQEEESGLLKKILMFPVKIILALLYLAWRLFKIALFILAVLMILSKTIRHNVLSWIFRSKAGPLVEKIIFAIRSLWAALTKKEKPQHYNLEDTRNNVFISHSSKDRNIPENRIETVMNELDNRQIKYWISSKNLDAGDLFSSKITGSIKDCSVFVLFVSKASLASRDVKNEMGLAYKYNKKILPIQIEKFDPMRDSDWEYWFTTCQIQPVYENNAEEIGKFVDKVEAHYKEAIAKTEPKEKKRVKNKKQKNEEHQVK